MIDRVKLFFNDNIGMLLNAITSLESELKVNPTNKEKITKNIN